MSEARDKYYIWKDEIDIPLCVDEYVSQLESEKAELIKTLNNWLISFKSTLRKQDYQVETFNVLNNRYIESAELLKKHGVEI